jgi:Mrp family chromosome partitioning ATPase/capsular polysaccharide biosynthesis protein
LDTAGSKNARCGNGLLVTGSRTEWAQGNGAWDAEAVDVSRHFAALKRARWLIVAMVVSMTVAVFVFSAFLPKTYEAKARIVADDETSGLASGDVETVKRRLATVQTLLTTRSVLAAAAARLHLSSRDDLQDHVTASVEPQANIVDVKARDGDAVRAAAIANTVARTFLAYDEAQAATRLTRERAQLVRALDRSRNPAERSAIRQRLSELSVTGAVSASDLSLAEPARAPREASSPSPIRNAVFAFFGAVFLAILAALALGQLAPRLTGARELAAVTRAPLVAALPTRIGRRRQRGLAESAYRELRSSLALQLPPALKIVAVSGDLPGSPVAPVAAALARTLADDGSRTLVVEANLRRPGTHELLGTPRSPGVADVLSDLRRGADSPAEALLAEAIVPAGASIGQHLDVLPSGTPADAPSQLLAHEATEDFFVALELLDYRHIVVETPPLLGGVDGPLVARHADALLTVCQLDRLTPDDAAELGELLRRLEVRFVGLVAVGADDRSHLVAVTPWPRQLRSRIEA